MKISKFLFNTATGPLLNAVVSGYGIGCCLAIGYCRLNTEPAAPREAVGVVVTALGALIGHFAVGRLKSGHRRTAGTVIMLLVIGGLPWLDGLASLGAAVALGAIWAVLRGCRAGLRWCCVLSLIAGFTMVGNGLLMSGLQRSLSEQSEAVALVPLAPLLSQEDSPSVLWLESSPGPGAPALAALPYVGRVDQLFWRQYEVMNPGGFRENYDLVLLRDFGGSFGWRRQQKLDAGYAALKKGGVIIYPAESGWLFHRCIGPTRTAGGMKITGYDGDFIVASKGFELIPDPDALDERLNRLQQAEKCEIIPPGVLSAYFYDRLKSVTFRLPVKVAPVVLAVIAALYLGLRFISSRGRRMAEFLSAAENSAVAVLAVLAVSGELPVNVNFHPVLFGGIMLSGLALPLRSGIRRSLGVIGTVVPAVWLLPAVRECPGINCAVAAVVLLTASGFRFEQENQSRLNSADLDLAVWLGLIWGALVFGAAWWLGSWSLPAVVAALLLLRCTSYLRG